MARTAGNNVARFLIASGLTALCGLPTVFQPAPRNIDIFSYNPYAANSEYRISEICRTLHGDVIGLQGTQRRQFGQSLFNVSHDLSHLHPLQVTRHGDYTGYHWGYGNGRFTNKATGVSLLIRRKTFSPAWVTQVISPPPALQGRGGALRLKHGTLDVCFFCLYSPSEPRNTEERNAAEAFYTWLYSALARLPRRSLCIFLGDLNAHVGSIWNTEDVGPQSVGSFQPQAENNNGWRFRHWMQQHHLCAANTHFPSAAGPTYWAPTGHGSRVDYIVVPLESLPSVQKIDIWRKAARELQVFQTARPRDHSPLHMRIQVARFHEPKQQPPGIKWDYSKINTALYSTRNNNNTQPFIQDIHDTFSQPHIYTRCQQLLLQETLDDFWDFFNGQLREIAAKHFTLNNNNNQHALTLTLTRQAPCGRKSRSHFPSCNDRRQSRFRSGNTARSVIRSYLLP
ncbi:unnamed protein product [Polarella glacialis]|uniref:Endonuclease/exonuclease/phosphatase domain-containing protein n=1 Tax=Polarella glacialis TaxID=89957 RepID=A0A813HSW4_POLGL|nr:unnamed protein product [Polarella glacialis]